MKYYYYKLEMDYRSKLEYWFIKSNEFNVLLTFHDNKFVPVTQLKEIAPRLEKYSGPIPKDVKKSFILQVFHPLFLQKK